MPSRTLPIDRQTVRLLSTFVHLQKASPAKNLSPELSLQDPNIFIIATLTEELVKQITWGNISRMPSRSLLIGRPSGRFLILYVSRKVFQHEISLPCRNPITFIIAT